jgi:hypothetical protein
MTPSLKVLVDLKDNGPFYKGPVIHNFFLLVVVTTIFINFFPDNIIF